jgi:PTH1 family peptidyl-tRNA hydrolase
VLQYTSIVFWRRRPKLDPAFLVFGLGNPGLNYVRTRHNVGWWVLDELARRHGVEQSGHRSHGQFDIVRLGGVLSALIKPTTYMNRSGSCVGGWLRGTDARPWVVIFDDISMETGKVRFRDGGSSGGHKGAKDIIRVLGSEEFQRIKIGVGAPPPGEEASNYVLAPPDVREEDLLAGAVARVADAVELLARGEREAAINSLIRVE